MLTLILLLALGRKNCDVVQPLFQYMPKLQQLVRCQYCGCEHGEEVWSLRFSILSSSNRCLLMSCPDG